MRRLSFPSTLAALMDFVDEPVTVRVASVDAGGDATVAASRFRTLTFDGSPQLDESDRTQNPIVLGFCEHDCTVAVHPNAFRGSYQSPTTLTIEMAALSVEFQRADSD